MSILKKDGAGNRFWYNESEQLYREDGPAVEYLDGNKFWYINGKLHREDGPACEYTDGQKCWYYNGKHIKCDSDEEFFRLIRLKAFW